MGILLVPGSGLAAVLGEAVPLPSPVVALEVKGEVVQTVLPDVASGRSEKTLPSVPVVPEVTPSDGDPDSASSFRVDELDVPLATLLLHSSKRLGVSVTSAVGVVSAREGEELPPPTELEETTNDTEKGPPAGEASGVVRSPRLT